MVFCLGKENRECGGCKIAGNGNRTVMGGNDFFCDSQSQSGAACLSGSCAVQTVKFFKDGIQLMGRDRISLVGKGECDSFVIRGCLHMDL